MQKLALVTGGTRGIGFATTLRLLQQGHRVIACSRTGELDGQVPHEFLPHLHVIAFDLEDVGDIEAFAQRIKNEFGDVQILINNAGVSLKNEQGHSNTSLTTGVQEFHRTMQINALSPMLLTQQLLPGMQKLGWGRIVNVASLAGRSKTAVSGPAYMMSKAALLAWTRAVALEMAPYGIACNAVAPGRVQTKMAMQGGDEVNDRIAKSIPIGRIGQAHEIAYAVAMLCTDEAAFTIGACLDINGGVFMN